MESECPTGFPHLRLDQSCYHSGQRGQPSTLLSCQWGRGRLCGSCFGNMWSERPKGWCSSHIFSAIIPILGCVGKRWEFPVACLILTYLLGLFSNHEDKVKVVGGQSSIIQLVNIHHDQQRLESLFSTHTITLLPCGCQTQKRNSRDWRASSTLTLSSPSLMLSDTVFVLTAKTQGPIQHYHFTILPWGCQSHTHRKLKPKRVLRAFSALHPSQKPLRHRNLPQWDMHWKRYTVQSQRGLNNWDIYKQKSQKTEIS